ncbi:MAG: DUF5309 family protein [Raoultibacter sp.]
MAVQSFLGLRATNDFTLEGERPKHWREGILKYYPNGQASLTAITSLMRSKAVDDPEFSWFTRGLTKQRATVTGVYTDAGLATALAGPVTVGQKLYIKMAEAEVKQFVAGHVVMLRNAADVNYDLVCLQVEPSVQAGAKSYITVQAKEASKAGANPVSANISAALIIGTAHPEGGYIPQAISLDAEKWRNYTQIFRNSFEITRTASKTRLRTGDKRKQMQMDCLELHSIEMEKAFIFGVPSEEIAPNDKPIRTTGGLIWAVKQGGVVDSPITNPDVAAGSKWLDYGLDYLDFLLEKIFRYGSTEKMAYVGNGTVLALNRLARKHGNWDFTSATASFGIDITKWVTPFGTLSFKTHPLLSHEPTNQHSMLIFEPKDIEYRFVTDTTYHKDTQNHGEKRRDAEINEYLTECGLEFHNPQGWAWINGLGLDKPTNP